MDTTLSAPTTVIVAAGAVAAAAAWLGSRPRQGRLLPVRVRRRRR